MADAQTATDNNGQYAFTGLRAGTYGVEISGFDMDEVGFGSVSSSATVGVGESKIISFDGTYLRTAGIMGQVSVEGVGLEGVTVTMTGEGEDETDVTDAGGLYGFSKLKAGDYSVAISGFDPDEVEFSTTSMNVSVALGETANIPFEGTLLRTSGISGRVSYDGMGLDGVTVTLAGAAEDTRTTMNGGQYAFAGLAEGTYVVTISGWDEVAYNFDEKTTATIMLGDAVSHIENFDGTQTRTAGISGVLFIDEVVQDKMHTAGEPTLSAALAPLVEHGLLDPVMLAGLLAKTGVEVRGPDLNTADTLAIDPLTSTFTSAGLVAGTYQVSLLVNDDAVAMALAAAGVESVGEAAVVTLGAGMKEPVNFPFEITMQTINVGAVMAMADEENSEIPADRPDVVGVKLELYATAQGAEDRAEALMLMEGTTGEDGRATFDFARMEDSGPGGTETDNLVFVRLAEEDGTDEDLQATANEIMEIQYPGIERLTQAPNTVRFVNVAVNVQFWIKSVAGARGGDMGLGGWATEYCMPMDDDPETEEKDAVVCTGEDAGFKPIMMGEGDDAEPAMTNDGEDVETDLGKGTLSFMAYADNLPAMVYLRAAEDQDKDMGEMWEQTDALMHSHNGFILPENNDPAENTDELDKGPIYVTFETQSLTVGVYRETDDQPGFTDYRSDYPGGDHRPTMSGIEVELMYSESGGRLSKYDYMTFDKDGKRTVEVDNPASVPKWDAKTEAGGTVTFKHLPADIDFTVRLRAGSDRTEATDRDVDAFGGDLDDMTVGSFGADGGAGPEVRLCPLTTTSRPDFLGEKSDDCATFAYQWTSGTVSGNVTGLRKDVEATVTLDPITSVHSEGDDDDVKGNAAGAARPFKFSGVQDGVYMLVLSGDDVDEDESDELVVYHDETSTDDDYDGEVFEKQVLDATSLRAMIKGVVANNRIGNSAYTLSSDEAGVGVTVGLYEVGAGKDKKKGTADDVPGDAVEDDDGDPITMDTDEDGAYAFEDLSEGDDYFVQVDNCDGCVAYHSIDADDYDFVAYAPATAKVFEDDDKNMLPAWDHDATTLGGVISGVADGGFVDFALLYTDGELTGEVSEPFDEVGDHDIEFARCLTVNAAVEADPDASPPVVAVPGGTECQIHDDTYEDEVETNEDGEWSIDGLREGVYEVTVNPKGGYRVYDKDVAASEDFDGFEAVATQLVVLREGSGAAEEAETVALVNGRLGREATLADLVFATASAPATSLFDNFAADDFDYEVTTARDYADDLIVSAESTDDDAMIAVAVKAAAEAADVADPAKKDYVSVKSEDRHPVARMEGANAITVRVTAANGYAEESYEVTFTRTEAQDDAEITDLVIECVLDTGVDCPTTGSEPEERITYGEGYTAGTDDGSLVQSANPGRQLFVTIPHNVRGDFTLTPERASDSDLATVEYKLASEDDDEYDDGEGTNDLEGEFAVPGTDGKVTVNMRVTPEDPDEDAEVWTIEVTRSKAPTS